MSYSTRLYTCIRLTCLDKFYFDINTRRECLLNLMLKAYVLFTCAYAYKAPCNVSSDIND